MKSSIWLTCKNAQISIRKYDFETTSTKGNIPTYQVQSLPHNYEHDMQVHIYVHICTHRVTLRNFSQV